MVVALVTNHLRNGFFIFRPGEGYEYVMTLILVAIALAGLGGGEWSLDNALDIVDNLSGWAGFILSAAIGIGSGLLTMAIFYRPPQKTA